MVIVMKESGWYAILAFMSNFPLRLLICLDQDGKRHGHGVCIWADGRKYDGGTPPLRCSMS
jgi:hypothetical protein